MTRWKLGDQVMALVTGGGYAEYCLAHERHCLPIPPGIDRSRLRAIPETFFTVWHNVFERGGLKAGETFLVHGGSSGIGTTAIQLAKAFGARVYRDRRVRRRNARPAASSAPIVAINYKTEDFVAAMKAATSGKGVDVILDMVGGDYIKRNYEAAAVDGRIVQIALPERLESDGRLRPHDAEAPDPYRLDPARPLGRRQGRHRAAPSSSMSLPMIATGRVKPVIDSTFPLAEPPPRMPGWRAAAIRQDRADRFMWRPSRTTAMSLSHWRSSSRRAPAGNRGRLAVALWPGGGRRRCRFFLQFQRC